MCLSKSLIFCPAPHGAAIPLGACLFARDRVLNVAVRTRCDGMWILFAWLRLLHEVRRYLAMPNEESGKVGDGCIAFVARWNQGAIRMVKQSEVHHAGKAADPGDLGI